MEIVQAHHLKCSHDALIYFTLQEIGKTLICKMQMQQCTTFWDRDFVHRQFVIHMTHDSTAPNAEAVKCNEM